MSIRSSSALIWGILLSLGISLGMQPTTGQAASADPHAPATAAGAPSRSLSLSEIESFFDVTLTEQMAAEHLVGATVAVVQDDALIFAKGYGYADQAQRVPVQADRTLFFVGSAGKLFTWTAVMQLAETGQLDLHADVNRYLDFEIPAAFGQPITLHHLMTHTAGFEEQANALLQDDPAHVLPLREFLLRFLPQRVYPPGTVMAYSNYGTALAGYIVQRGAGQPFDQFLTERQLQPLGMTHSAAGQPLPPALAADLSKGYRYGDGRHSALDFEWTAATPAAPVRATAADLSRFLLAHLDNGCVDGNCVLRAETVRQMHSQQFTHHPQMLGMAYGFLEMNINGQRVLWHLGESARFITVLALIPEQNLGLVVSYNTSPADGRAILFRFMDAFFPVQRALLPATPLPGWEARAAAANGFYLPARSAHTTLQRVLAYLQAAPVIIANGALTYNGWRFVETEPWLFRQAAGDRVLALRQDASGQRWLFVGPLAYYRIPCQHSPGFLLPAAGFGLLVFLSAWLAWPLAAWRRRRQGRAAANGGARWLAAGLGLFNVGLLIWFALLMAGFGATFVFPQAAAGLIARLSWLAVPWTLCVLALAGRAWVRRTGGLAGRVHYSLVALAAVVFLWLFWSVNLLGGRA